MSGSRIRNIQDLCNPPPASEHNDDNESPRAASSRSQGRLSGIRHSSSSSPQPGYANQPPQPSPSSSSSSIRLPSIDQVLASSTLAPSYQHGPSSSTSSIPAPLPHRRSASSTSTHRCERCFRSFTRKADVAKHIRVVHDKEKRFICDICGRPFGRKDYLAVRYPTILSTSLFK